MSACTTHSTAPTGVTLTRSASVIDKLAPPSVAYDIAIYLCDAKLQIPAAAGRCHHRDASVAEQQALGRRLDADAHVTNYVYLSTSYAYLLGTRLQPSAAKYAQLGDFPASYFVALADSTGADAVVAKYATMSGVALVNLCDRRPQCQVATLRDIGFVK
jgi:hypothetical protein